MLKSRIRVPERPQLDHGSEITGNYPAVALHHEKTLDDLAEFFAVLAEDFYSGKVIADYSQCALLLHSVRDNRNNAAPFMQALRKHGIPYYNPRSRSLLEEPVIKTVLGALLSTIDPDKDAQNALVLQTIKDQADDWGVEFTNGANN
jgi:superfamily I DNA/RNA helicase